MEKENTFRIGICMAGAVSAGAYSAGVMDYLLEALESWQKAKDLNLEGVPKHNIRIEVISGASAGGMTAAICAAALQINFPHVNQNNYADGSTSKLNPLFDSWVNLTEEKDKDMMAQMLQTDDFSNPSDDNPEKEVRAGFNSGFIDNVAKRILKVAKDPDINRPYVAGDMELLTTLTNLRGYNYNIKFITDEGAREHRMTMHRDFTHFQMNETGEYHNDGKIPIHFNDAKGFNKELLISSAMATGAFPVGLRLRLIERKPEYINDNKLLNITFPDKIVLPENGEEYRNINVDGGLINNEPFELTEDILRNRRKADMEKNGLKADDYFQEVTASKIDTTIIMIDPFPNYNEKPGTEYYPLLAWKYTLTQIFGSMRQQLMVKMNEISKAYDENNYSRFMIAPIRTQKGEKQNYSIACGSFGGFGGFFSKAFRVHDFMLGRRNCQRFLQNHLCIEAGVNPILTFGYEGINDETMKLYKAEINGKVFLPLIPDIRVEADPVSSTYKIIKPGLEEEFTYPQIKLSYLLGLKGQLKLRFAALASNLFNGKDPRKKESGSEVVKNIRKKSAFSNFTSSFIKKPATKAILRMGIYFGMGQAANQFIDAVVNDMDKRELLENDVK